MKNFGSSLASILYCPECGKEYSLDQTNHYASCCNQPLLVRYQKVKLSPSVFSGRESTMWRYFEMLPLRDPRHILSLGEGMTPLVSLEQLKETIRQFRIFKDFMIPYPQFSKK